MILSTKAYQVMRSQGTYNQEAVIFSTKLLSGGKQEHPTGKPRNLNQIHINENRYH